MLAPCQQENGEKGVPTLSESDNDHVIDTCSVCRRSAENVNIHRYRTFSSIT